MEVEDNVSKQVDEIEALSSIYDKLWNVEDEVNRIYSVKVEEGSFQVTLFVTLPTEYPSRSPPTYELSAPWLKGPERQDICGQLEELYLENIGEPILFQWIEKLRTILQCKCESASEHKDADLLAASVEPSEINTPAVNNLDNNMETIPISHGEIITDRKSVFQGHAASVVTVGEVRSILSQLYGMKKISNATHNIFAYRIYKEDTQTFLQDCEDDGEHQAGGRILHLLQILDIRNILVVVSRWYGGILLGPDRFRHINNAARKVLEIAGYIGQSDGALNSNKQTKKKR